MFGMGQLDSWTVHRMLYLNIRNTIMENWELAGHRRSLCLESESSFDKNMQTTVLGAEETWGT